MSTDIEQFKKFLESENVTQHIKRFYEHMPDVDDIIISILKGHLLIEEQLFELITVEAVKRQALKDLNAMLAQGAVVRKGAGRTVKYVLPGR